MYCEVSSSFKHSNALLQLSNLFLHCKIKCLIYLFFASFMFYLGILLPWSSCQLISCNFCHHIWMIQQKMLIAKNLFYSYLESICISPKYFRTQTRRDSLTSRICIRDLAANISEKFRPLSSSRVRRAWIAASRFQTSRSTSASRRSRDIIFLLK